MSLSPDEIRPILPPPGVNYESTRTRRTIMNFRSIDDNLLANTSFPFSSYHRVLHQREAVRLHTESIRVIAVLREYQSTVAKIYLTYLPLCLFLISIVLFITSKSYVMSMMSGTIFVGAGAIYAMHVPLDSKFLNVFPENHVEHPFCHHIYPFCGIIVGQISKYVYFPDNLRERNIAYGWSLQIICALLMVCHIIVYFVSKQAIIMKRIQRDTVNPSEIVDMIEPIQDDDDDDIC